LTKHITFKNFNKEDTDEDFLKELFPSFIWVLRDFSLKLEDSKGNKITSDEYLENSLKDKDG